MSSNTCDGHLVDFVRTLLLDRVCHSLLRVVRRELRLSGALQSIRWSFGAALPGSPLVHHVDRCFLEVLPTNLGLSGTLLPKALKVVIYTKQQLFAGMHRQYSSLLGGIPHLFALHFFSHIPASTPLKVVRPFLP